MADVTSPFGFPYPEPTDLVRDGATDIEALAEGVNDQFLAGFQFAGQRIFTSSGQFEKADPLGTGDIGLRAIRVTVQAGGGGGGGVGASTDSGSSGAGGGGGGGGSAQKVITDIGALAASETVTRGSGGSGAQGDGAGSNGGTSAFGSVAVATGGTGGRRGAIFASPRVSGGGREAGVGTVGDLLMQGGAGTSGYILEGGGERGTITSNGGSSQFSGQSHSAVPPSVGDGNDGEDGGTGAGGSGAANAGAASANNGGAGGNGIVIVEVFV